MATFSNGALLDATSEIIHHATSEITITRQVKSSITRRNIRISSLAVALSSSEVEDTTHEISPQKIAGGR
jgi:hypothetical protein